MRRFLWLMVRLARSTVRSVVLSTHDPLSGSPCSSSKTPLLPLLTVSRVGISEPRGSRQVIYGFTDWTTTSRRNFGLMKRRTVLYIHYTNCVHVYINRLLLLHFDSCNRTLKPEWNVKIVLQHEPSCGGLRLHEPRNLSSKSKLQIHGPYSTAELQHHFTMHTAEISFSMQQWSTSDLENLTTVFLLRDKVWSPRDCKMRNNWYFYFPDIWL